VAADPLDAESSVPAAEIANHCTLSVDQKVGYWGAHKIDKVEWIQAPFRCMVL